MIMDREPLVLNLVSVRWSVQADRCLNPIIQATTSSSTMGRGAAAALVVRQQQGSHRLELASAARPWGGSARIRAVIAAGVRTTTQDRTAAPTWSHWASSNAGQGSLALRSGPYRLNRSAGTHALLGWSLTHSSGLAGTDLDSESRPRGFQYGRSERITPGHWHSSESHILNLFVSKAAQAGPPALAECLWDCVHLACDQDAHGSKTRK
jgi:hypothetical protein